MVKANKSKNNVKNLKTVSINNLSHFYGKNENKKQVLNDVNLNICLLYTSPSPRDQEASRMPSSA